MYDRILLPTDGSDCADRAVAHAIDIAAQYDAELHALYVVYAARSEAGPNYAATMEALESHGEDTLDAVVDSAEAAGVATVDVLRRGTPHRVIVEYASDADADLVVMGTHGRTGLERYLLGSVTEKVVRTSDVPVLTVRSPDGAAT